MSRNVLHDLIRNLQALMTCPSCGSRYKSEDIQFVGQVDLACLLQMNCATCSLPVLATVLVNEEPGSRKIITDFDVDEINDITSEKPMSSNDVIGMHQFLKTFDGNFENIFTSLEQDKS